MCSRRSPRTTARSGGARRSSTSPARRWTRSRSGSETRTAATSGCATGRRGSRRSSARWSRTASRTPSASFSRRTSARSPSPATSRRSPTGSSSTAARIEFEHIPSYHDAPGLIEAFAARVAEGLSRWPEAERERVHVVFSAHSLPQRVLASGDPYDAQCRETALLVAERAGLSDERWSWSYQSAGRTAEPWAGPDLGEHLEELAGAWSPRRRRRAGRVRLRPRRAPLRRRRSRARDRGRARDAARAPTRAERRPCVRRGARRARPRASCTLAGGGSRRMKVVVVGGGIAGLAAARRLEALIPGVEVVLVERTERLGGKLLTERVGRLRDRGRRRQLPLAQGAGRRACARSSDSRTSSSAGGPRTRAPSSGAVASFIRCPRG